ncbi:Centrin-1 [Phlyctochytrium planicorne]|nr:Centrin-1 [Phlyctochytrium planicorne]
MQAFKNFFAKPPTGPITQNIEIATADLNQEVDWAVIIATKDLIESSPDGIGEGMRAIKKQLKSKSPIVVNYSITALDYFVNNCGIPFRNELASKENISYIQKFLLREDLAPENRGRMLELIAEWAQKYDNPPDIRRLYHSLVGSGFRFPNQLAFAAPMQIVSSPQHPQFASVSHLSPEERRNHVEFDLNLAANAVQVLVETLTFADKSEDLSKNDLLSEFRQKCLHMQDRISRLLAEVSEEDLVAKLIQSNSDIIAALEQYNGAIESRNIEAAKIASTHTEPVPPTSSTPIAPTPTTANLLAFDFEKEEEEPIEELLKPARKRVEPTPSDDPFADTNASGSSNAEPYVLKDENEIAPIQGQSGSRRKSAVSGGAFERRVSKAALLPARNGSISESTDGENSRRPSTYNNSRRVSTVGGGSRRASVVVNQNNAGHVRIRKELELFTADLDEDEEAEERIPEIAVTEVKSKHYDLTAGQLQEIREVFDLFDTDGSGSIDMKEFRIVMRSLGFNPTQEEVFAMAGEFDESAEPVLSFEEFLFLMAAKISEKDMHEEMRKSFKLFDLESRGKIGFRDLKRVAKDIGEDITDEDIQTILEETDKDGDGEIGEEDWVRVFAAGRF